jgi:hypothetical protein
MQTSSWRARRKGSEQLKIPADPDKYPNDIGAAMLWHHEMMENSDRASRSAEVAVDPNNANVYNLIATTSPSAAARTPSKPPQVPVRLPTSQSGRQRARFRRIRPLRRGVANLNEALRLKPDFFNSTSIWVSPTGKGSTSGPSRATEGGAGGSRRRPAASICARPCARRG